MKLIWGDSTRGRKNCWQGEILSQIHIQFLSNGKRFNFVSKISDIQYNIKTYDKSKHLELIGLFNTNYSLNEAEIWNQAEINEEKEHEKW